MIGPHQKPPPKTAKREATQEIMVSCAQIENMLAHIAEKYSLSLSEIKDSLAQENLLPKKMAKEINPVEVVKEARVWATKRTEEIANEKGVRLEEITTRSGKTGLIVAADIELALKSRKPTITVEVPEEIPEVPAKAPAKPKKSAKKPVSKPLEDELELESESD